MSVFEEACFLANQSWVDSLPTEFKEVVYSKKHERYMNNLIDKMRGNRYHRFTRRVTVALIAAVIFVSMTVTAFAVPATRDFIIERFFDHSTYSVVNGEYSEVEGITVGYIPEGFEKTYENNENNQILLEYKSITNNWFNIKKYPSDQVLDFDTELYDYEKIKIDGLDIIHFYNEKMNGYLWNNNKEIYVVNGNIDEEELIAIIKNVN